MSDAGLDAMSNFLALGLHHYAVNLALNDREYAIATALYDLATKPKAPEDASLFAKAKAISSQSGGPAWLSLLQRQPRTPQQP